MNLNNNIKNENIYKNSMFEIYSNCNKDIYSKFKKDDIIYIILAGCLQKAIIKHPIYIIGGLNKYKIELINNRKEIIIESFQIYN